MHAPPVRKDRDSHPFGRGGVILCKYREPGCSPDSSPDSSHQIRLADIIERRQTEVDSDEEDCYEEGADGGLDANGNTLPLVRKTYWSYYIHWHDLNRRMDQWVDSRR